MFHNLLEELTVSVGLGLGSETVLECTGLKYYLTIFFVIGGQVVIKSSHQTYFSVLLTSISHYGWAEQLLAFLSCTFQFEVFGIFYYKFKSGFICSYCVRKYTLFDFKLAGTSVWHLGAQKLACKALIPQNVYRCVKIYALACMYSAC